MRGRREARTTRGAGRAPLDRRARAVVLALARRQRSAAVGDGKGALERAHSAATVGIADHDGQAAGEMRATGARGMAQVGDVQVRTGPQDAAPARDEVPQGRVAARREQEEIGSRRGRRRRCRHLGDTFEDDVSIGAAEAERAHSGEGRLRRLRRFRHCDLALAGGVNLLLDPDVTAGFTAARMLAPDGRCKTFDAAADGYVRGEGCGMIVLKRLAEARRDGDPVLALIRGTAVNQDGRSNGLTAPNGLAQVEVIRRALADAGVQPWQIGYVEAHGTGTPLGDPIEVRALRTALGVGRAPGQRCAVGSVKTNFGHLEAAAGIAGLLKVVLALRHCRIPPHLHLRELNPEIALGEDFFIPTRAVPWPESPGSPRTARRASAGSRRCRGRAAARRPRDRRRPASTGRDPRSRPARRRPARG
jgi:hypothetical protein